MRVYYDGEFYEDGKTITLLSLGMVNELGERHYAINGDADYQAAADGNPWLVEHVFPSLPVSNELGRWKVDYLDPRVMPYTEMAHNTRAFLEYCNRLEDKRSGRPEELHWRNLELWAYYGAYDHVALCQLIGGRMIELPSYVPMYSHDLQVEFDRLGLDGELKDYVPMAAGEHDAQADALWNREAHLWMLTTGVTP